MRGLLPALSLQVPGAQGGADTVSWICRYVLVGFMDLDSLLTSYAYSAISVSGALLVCSPELLEFFSGVEVQLGIGILGTIALSVSVAAATWAVRERSPVHVAT